MLIENNTEALAKQTFGYVDYVLCEHLKLMKLEKAKDNFSIRLYFKPISSNENY